MSCDPSSNYFFSTTSTLSVGSTGSQARLIQSSHPPSSYQPVLMKDLGKHHSPTQNLNIVDLTQNGDDEQKLTDKVMDKHLCELVTDNLKSDTCDIAKYMANLKEKHLEIQQFDLTEANVAADQANSNSNDYNDIGNNMNVDSGSSNKSSETDDDNSIASSPPEMVTVISNNNKKPDTPEQTIIDKKVDKVFVGEKPPKPEKSEHTISSKKLLKSPRSSIDSRSPDRLKSVGSSPVKIIKVKSPRGSVDSGKRLSVSSRDSSKDRSPDRIEKKRTASPSRRPSEGILKRSVSPKPDPITVPPPTPNTPITPNNLNANTSSILKRSTSPNKAKSPERGCLKKTLSPRNSVESRSPDRDRLYPSNVLSPRSSIDSRSPDRGAAKIYHVRSASSPRSSFDSRSPDHLEVSKGFNRSPRNSFDSRSPDRGRRSLSASARSSFESSKSPDPGYYPYSSTSTYRSESRSPDRYSHSPAHGHTDGPTTAQQQQQQRLSKSLDRSPRPDVFNFQFDDSYIPSPQRSHSHSHSNEPNFNKYGIDLSHSNESLARAIEYPTCVECTLHQKKPS